jgi:transposase-like protein
MSGSAPLHCPYCADENLWPHGQKHGEWECRACRRAFAVKHLGILSPSTTNAPGREART